MPIKTIKSNTAIHGIHNAMAITLRIRNGKVFIFQCCSVRFCGLYIGYESREATGFTIPFWRRANARNVVFVTWSESDDEGLTLALLFLYGANLTLFNFFDNKFLSCTSSPTRHGTAISLQTKPWAMLTLTRLMNLYTYASAVSRILAILVMAWARCQACHQVCDCHFDRIIPRTSTDPRGRASNAGPSDDSCHCQDQFWAELASGTASNAMTSRLKIPAVIVEPVGWKYWSFSEQKHVKGEINVGNNLKVSTNAIS